MSILYQIRAVNPAATNIIDNKIYTNFNTARLAIEKYIKRIRIKDNQKLIDYGYGIAIVPNSTKDDLELMINLSDNSVEIHAIISNVNPNKPAIQYLPYGKCTLENYNPKSEHKVFIPIEVKSKTDEHFDNITLLDAFGYIDEQLDGIFRLKHRMLTSHAININTIKGQKYVVFNVNEKLNGKSEKEIIDYYDGQFSDGYFENGIHLDKLDITYDSSREIIYR